MVQHVSALYVFKLLNNILVHATVYLSIHHVVDVWVSATSKPLGILLSYMSGYKFPSEHDFISCWYRTGKGGAEDNKVCSIHIDP